jgi:sugar lactone lactonase YvrE
LGWSLVVTKEVTMYRTFVMRAMQCLAVLCLTVGAQPVDAVTQDFPLFVAEYVGNGVYRLDESGNMSNVVFVRGLLNSVRNDNAGNLYTCSEDSSEVSRIDPAGTVSAFASGFDNCFGLLVGPDGTLYVSNFDAGNIEMVPPAGSPFTTLATGLVGPGQMAFDSDGSIVVTEFYGGQVSRVDAQGHVTVVATGLSLPFGIAVAAEGNIYVSEFLSGRIVRIDSSGAVSAFLELGRVGPSGIDFDRQGRLFIAELSAGRIVIADVKTGDVTLFRDNLVTPAGLNFQRSFVTPATRVTVDLKPDSDQNPLNPKSKGVVPVAVLGTETFDATKIDARSVRFGATGTEAAPAHSQLEDVNGDGRLDMVFQFRTTALGIPPTRPARTQVPLKLTGRTVDGQVFEGEDVADITP